MTDGGGTARPNKIAFNRDRNFDLQLSASLRSERKLAELLNGAKIELKTESWQWEQTGNICVEFACDGNPSGIATTEADVWVHELRREGRTLVYLWFPIERLRAREYYRRGHYRTGRG
jgi:hypothetical protein